MSTQLLMKWPFQNSIIRGELFLELHQLRHNSAMLIRHKIGWIHEDVLAMSVGMPQRCSIEIMI